MTLAECGFASNGLSAQAEWRIQEPAELAIFAETGARAIVSLPQASLARVLTLAAQYRVAALLIGRVARGQFQLSLNGYTVIRDSADSLRAIWSGAIEDAVLGKPASKQI